jgi:hypothetical protein
MTLRYVAPLETLVTTGYKMGAVRRLLKPLTSCVAGRSVSIVVVVPVLALL